MGESLVGHTPIGENATVLMTEVFYGQKRKYLVDNDLYHIHDKH